MQNRLFIIALDALDFDLASKWAGEGHMPNFRRILESSRWGPISNPLAFEAGALWPNFAMGVGPDVHGQYIAPYIFDPADYEMRVRRADEFAFEPYWVIASKAGRRVAVVDVPYCLIHGAFAGTQVADWLTHVRTYPHGLTTRPAELSPQIIAKYGNNPFTDPRRCPTNHVELDTPSKVIEFRNHLLDRVSAKTAFLRDLMRRESWDLFLSVFHDAHDVGHMCWHVHDPTMERHDPLIAAEAGDPVFDVYVALDEAIGRLAEAVGTDTTLMFYLTHGMGPECTGSYFLDAILARIENAYYGGAAPTKLDSIRRIYRRLAPSPLRDRLNRLKTVKTAYEKNQKSIYRNRRFFETIPNHATGGVRINKKGREHFGMVEPGPACEALCDRLCRDLREIINLDTGEPIAESVTLTADLYGGPKLEELPDILVEWNKTAQIDRIYSPLFGTMDNTLKGDRSGDHVNRTGYYFLSGPGFSPGRNSAPVDVLDFAPTILTLLGVDVHDRQFPGQVIESFLKEPVRAIS